MSKSCRANRRPVYRGKCREMVPVWANAFLGDKRRVVYDSVKNDLNHCKSRNLSLWIERQTQNSTWFPIDLNHQVLIFWITSTIALWGLWVWVVGRAGIRIRHRCRSQNGQCFRSHMQNTLPLSNRKYNPIMVDFFKCGALTQASIITLSRVFRAQGRDLIARKFYYKT